MELIYDMITSKPLIERMIARHGSMPQHNFFWYQYCKESGEENVLALFPGDEGILTTEDRKKRTAYLFSLPLASSSFQMPLLIEYLVFILSRGDIRRVEMDLDDKRRRMLLLLLPSSFHARAVFRTLVSPILDLSLFDPSLPGKHYKSLRNAKNRFFRDHTVEVQDARRVNPNDLHLLVEQWRKERSSHDKTYHERYHNLITGNFEGTVSARAFSVDGKISGLNAGWMIPNSKRYFAAVGLHNYALPDLGLMIYLEDLFWLKEHGYQEADMGESDKKLLQFKKQFSITSLYETHFFSVVRK